MDVPAYLSACSARVNEFLDKVVPPASEPPTALHEAMRHLLFPGGKRLRPAFAFAGCEAVGADPERALPAAAAAELIHTYSLVHDDLPCMDDDAERRGVPTVHVLFGESVAVLAGDALQALAFEVLAGQVPDSDAARGLAVAGELAAAAGSRWLVGGQVDDLAFDAAARGDAAVAAVESVHRRKSGALIVASVVSGGRLGGADEARLEHLRRHAEAAGLAFQIADDLLDDGEEDPCSLVRVLGPEGARQRAEALLERALAELEPLGEAARALRELAYFAVRREL